MSRRGSVVEEEEVSKGEEEAEPEIDVVVEEEIESIEEEVLLLRKR